MTSFSRLAKVIKGYTPPVGWIERAFASLVGNSTLPDVTSEDNGKVLGVIEGEWDTMNIPAQIPAVGENDKDKFLHTNASTGALEWTALTPASGVNF